MKRLVGVIGSGLMGRDPFDRRSWSTSSYHFFSELERRGALARAFGVEVPRFRRLAYMARNFRRDRSAWRMRFYNDIGYKDALTAEIARRLTPTDLECTVLQIGAMYDVPRVLRGRAACVSYHDGNLAETLRSPYAPRDLGARSVERALAYERAVYHGMSRVLAMSEYLRASFIRDFDVPASKVVTVGAGMNLDSMPDPVADKPYDRREVLFIGVDFGRKGGWELLRAFRAVRERVPDAVLHVVGPAGLAVPPAQEGGVVMHGFLDKTTPEGKARLDDLFRRSALFVMPSRYEPFGIAPLEAMVHQLPCLLTDGWAFREMVTPGVTGDLCRVDDVDDLAGRLTALLADPEVLRRMGATAREHVLATYTWPRVVDRVLAAVQEAEAAQHVST